MFQIARKQKGHPASSAQPVSAATHSSAAGLPSSCPGWCWWWCRWWWQCRCWWWCWWCC